MRGLRREWNGSRSGERDGEPREHQLLTGMRGGAVRTRSGDIYKPSVVRSYDAALRLHVLPELGGLKIADVQRRDVQRLADDLLASGRDPSTIRNALMPLRVIYRRALQTAMSR